MTRKQAWRPEIVLLIADELGTKKVMRRTASSGSASSPGTPHLRSGPDWTAVAGRPRSGVAVALAVRSSLGYGGRQCASGLCMCAAVAPITSRTPSFPSSWRAWRRNPDVDVALRG